MAIHVERDAPRCPNFGRASAREDRSTQRGVPPPLGRAHIGSYIGGVQSRAQNSGKSQAMGSCDITVDSGAEESV